ncbi:hypothetical protein COM90_08030 [Bacillus thuringiensis]|uniref:DUF2278 family protein n=1 Tax=Bacillus thuringiensis TaxID=1428 RepID=A0AB36TW25_BACTU|nr:YukJ family protein [Bacillus thuringiensis]MBZ3765541.1 YukJ family protein [Bacillus cereus]PEE61430.1 hypothetical protein COM74_29500 [Bacillus thuringiensis]PEE89331.1 hypothetical protein COM90_08030 [Bacillus thuringiensis]PFM93077.1 hypothetical protein COJ61_12470 [Bacillus thuringiensis]
MTLRNYKVLKGKAVNTDIATSGKPHFEIHIKDEQNHDYRIAVNIKSGARPSEVLYFASENFNSEQITKLSNLNSRFTSITENNRDIALDYIRGGLFDPKKMIALPHNKPGADNDLKEKIEGYINEAMDQNATIYAFGEAWGPEKNEPDKYFDFVPGSGIHDIHMKQGNIARWKSDDGIWQDGGLLIHLEDENGHATKPAKQCDHLHSNH